MRREEPKILNSSVCPSTIIVNLCNKTKWSSRTFYDTVICITENNSITNETWVSYLSKKENIIPTPRTAKMRLHLLWGQEIHHFQWNDHPNYPLTMHDIFLHGVYHVNNLI